MPIYVPSEAELDSVNAACQNAGLLNVPTDDLIVCLGHLASGDLPVNLDLIDAPLNHPDNINSQVLSVALAVIWPVRGWNATEAREIFRTISTELPANQLQKSVDHAVVAGVRRGWPIPIDVCISLLQEVIEASIHFLRGAPLAPGAVARGEGVPQHAGGLIPDLDCCWGEDFRDGKYWATGAILHRLRQPYAVLPMISTGHSIEIGCADEGVSFSHFFRGPVPAGARRNFRLVSGSATLLKNGAHFEHVGEGQRLMLRVLDEGVRPSRFGGAAWR